MTQNEYEHYRRRLDEQLASGIELLKAAHAQQIHALEMVWKMQSAEEPMRAAVPAPALEAPKAVPPRPSRRRAAGELIDEIQAALPSLPEVFDRRAVIQALGYEPDRASLYRALQELFFGGVIARAEIGGGRVPTTYRKKGTGHSPANP